MSSGCCVRACPNNFCRLRTWCLRNLVWGLRPAAQTGALARPPFPVLYAVAAPTTYDPPKSYSHRYE